MTLEELQNMWEVDSVIDQSDIIGESLKTHILHHKYSKITSTERLKYRKMLEKKKLLYIKLEGYYNGTIDGRDIGREPFLGTKLTNEGIKKRIEGDEEYVKTNILIHQQEELYELAYSIVLSVNSRNYTIKNHIDGLKFFNGVG